MVILHNLGFKNNDENVKDELFKIIVEAKYVNSSERYRQMSGFEGQLTTIKGIIETEFKEKYGTGAGKKLEKFMGELNKITKQQKEVAQLTSGSCFGEAALINANSTRMATIRCLTDCYFGILSKESFEQTIALI